MGAVRAYREAVNALVFVTSEMTPSHPRANAWRESYGAEVKAGAALDALLPAADGASAGEVGSR